jgi:hypothetical protein
MSARSKRPPADVIVGGLSVENVRHDAVVSLRAATSNRVIDDALWYWKSFVTE